MSIKGLTDRNMGFPEIGQIRKGAPKGEKSPGKDLTYFRVTFDERETEAAKLFIQVYGAQPTEIRVILPFNETERMWDAWLEAYTAGRMVARSDGEKFIYLVDTKTGEVKVKNGLPFTPYKDGMIVGSDFKNKPVKCRPVGRLKVIIPELARAVYLTVLTTSVHDIGNISAQLEAFKQLNSGQIAGIPFILRRRPKKISVPGSDSQRARMTKWMLSIESDPEWVRRKLIQIKMLALPDNGLNLIPEHTSPPEEILEGHAEDVEDEGDNDIPPGQPEEAPIEKLVEQPPMTLEEAQAVTNSEGKPYGEIDTDTLAHMANGMSRLAGTGKEKPEHAHKMLAATIILKARSEAVKPDAEQQPAA